MFKDMHKGTKSTENPPTIPNLNTNCHLQDIISNMVHE